MRFIKTLQTTFKSNRGMTLIEIMIVLAIIGTIASLLMKNLSGSQEKAKVKEAKIALGNVSQALQMYYSDCGKYPDSLEGLATSDSKCSNWGPEPYLSKKKLQDPWGNDFSYSAEGGNVTLKSFGKDGKEGGDGYNKDITLDE